MMECGTYETLKKQLKLLSERSEKNPDELPELSHAMAEIVAAIHPTLNSDAGVKH